MKLNIARGMIVFGGIIAIGLLVSIGIKTYAFDKLRVNGPVYTQIVYGKDLVADILPPPLYTVESYMLAMEAISSPELVARNQEKIAALKRAYDERRSYWKSSSAPDVLMKKLEDEVLARADVFWQVLEKQFLPALQANDLAGAGQALNALKGSFHHHEIAVNELVQMAVAFQAGEEGAAAVETDRLSMAATTSSVISVALLAAGLWYLRRRAVQPLATMSSYMETLAAGDYSRAVPFSDRRDEIGAVAKSVAIFREAAIERRTMRERAEDERRRREEQEAVLREQRAVEERDRRTVIDQLSGGLRRLSTGDLTAQIEAGFAPDFERLRSEFNGSVERLAQAISGVLLATGRLRSGSSEIAGATDDLAKRTEHQAASLEQTAAACDEITRDGAQLAGACAGSKPGDADCQGRSGTLRGRRPRCGRGDGTDRRFFDTHPADPQCHRRDSVPDQPAGLERRRRGGPGRRSWQGLCGRRTGSSRTGRPFGRCREGNQATYRNLGARGRGRCRTGQPDRFGADGY
ncbi:methyl-accepting chemotaxis protein [Sinorhizobium fredii]